MKLYLMRHGNSHSPTPGQPKALSPRGEKETAKIGRWLRKNGVYPQLLWHSPLPRAVQTAVLLSEELDLSPDLLILKKELTPEGNASEIAREIHLQNKETLIVSHLPLLKSLLSHFLDPEVDPEAFDFPTSSLCALEILKGKNHWLWSQHPQDL